MSRDFITCLRDAERFFREGRLGQARKRLEECLRELRAPAQCLPSWVVPGVQVQWTGAPPNYVYEVVSVSRDAPEWWFRGESVHGDGTKELMIFHRETGKRHWRRYG